MDVRSRVLKCHWCFQSDAIHDCRTRDFCDQFLFAVFFRPKKRWFAFFLSITSFCCHCRVATLMEHGTVILFCMFKLSDFGNCNTICLQTIKSPVRLFGWQGYMLSIKILMQYRFGSFDWFRTEVLSPDQGHHIIHLRNVEYIIVP